LKGKYRSKKREDVFQGPQSKGLVMFLKIFPLVQLKVLGGTCFLYSKKTRVVKNNPIEGFGDGGKEGEGGKMKELPMETSVGLWASG